MTRTKNADSTTLIYACGYANTRKATGGKLCLKKSAVGLYDLPIEVAIHRPCSKIWAIVSENTAA